MNNLLAFEEIFQNSVIYNPVTDSENVPFAVVPIHFSTLNVDKAVNLLAHLVSPV
jgi:hypothetical protein